MEAAKQEILAEIRAGFSGVNERLGEISEDIDQIKEILNTKPRFGVLIGGNFSGVCAYWQGREKEIEQLKNWIRDPEITLMGIEGTGGLGKTSLAEKVFDELKTEYCGYWADVSTGAIFTEVARKVLEYFNFPIPQQETELVQALISCLQQTKCLLVFDNLETLLQENEFVIGSFYDEFFRSWTNKRSESAIVVTTRERPNIRGFNHWISLEGFEETEGAAFLHGKGIKNNPEELKAFSRLVDGYPLLLRLVADLLIDDSPQNPRLERLTELGLKNLQQLLTHPDVKGNHRQREVGIVAVLDVSYQRLSEQLKTLLTVVTILRGEFDAEIALAVSGLEKTAAEIQQDLRQLVRRSWLLESENRLWSFQPVILAYLKHKAGEQTPAHLEAIYYYLNCLKPRQQWQTLDDVNEYLQIFYHRCQLGQYPLAFNTLGDDDVDSFLDLSGYNSTRVELYHQLVENWQPEGEYENWQFGTALTSLGNAYNSLGQYQQAINFYQQSLEIAQEIGNRRGVATSLGGLGNAYLSLGQYQRAIDFHQQSLEIKQEIGDRSGVAASLGNLGNAYNSLGQYQQAINFYQQSLEIAQEIGNRRGVATSLGGLGNAYYSLGQYQRAIDFYQQWLEIAQEIGNRSGVANSLGGLGIAYNSLGQYQQALDFYQQSLEIAQEIGDRSGVAASLNNLGNAYDSLGQYQQAIDFHQQSLEIQQEIGDCSGVAASLGNLGTAYNSLGQYQQAIDFYQQSLEIAQEIGDCSGVATSLGNLGTAYNSLGQYQQAIDFHQQSLEIAQEIGDRSGVAASLQGLGNAYNSLGQYQQAIDFHQQSLEIAQEIGDRRGVATSLQGLGNAYNSLGQYQQAIDFHQQSLEIAQEIGDRSGVANSLGGLGNAYDSLGQYQRAIDFYQQSLEIAQEIDYKMGEAISLNNLGGAYKNLENYQTAIQYYQQALAIQLENPQYQAIFWANLGFALGKINRTEDALGAYRNARELYQNLGLDADVQDCDNAIQQLTSPSPLSAPQSQGFLHWLNLQIRRFWRWLRQLGRS
ncbi:tetratricopeptide repeat protein [Planktothrix sp. FACHB-1365]|uniref:tetratricopeptide repeat protein n=1 Tax=Planktothrix sp. FACHB-1365 TaxID=2692855 RepID=UPI00168A1B26|nr:tetratricopeptide repeat protein [Planktothrix sp. FACHB-1365]MBD2483522.1 tetratricopeptide repeat protein [Planktothrix sp. FACHB-1365]